jgi:hypothetical protein
MNLPPRNPNAGVLDNIPNAPSAQATMAAQQQGARDSLNLQAQAPQANAALRGRVISDQAAGATSENAANAALDYAKARILANANLTQGAEAMVGLAQRYAPDGGDVATITQAIRQGLRL